jgi:hypothetical protein
MSPGSMRMALLMSAFALVPAACQAPPAADVTAPMLAATPTQATAPKQAAMPKQSAAPAAANSMLDLPVEKIAATPSGRAILDKDFPGLCTHPMYSSFESMSLNQLAAMSSGKMTPVMLAKAQKDLSKLRGLRTDPQTTTADATPAPSDNQASLSPKK